MAVSFGNDHGAIAWSHFTSVLRAQPKLGAHVQALYAPMNALDSALQQLTQLYNLESAVGAQLDGIGSIVGQKRIVSNALYLAFFGYQGQIAGRGYGVAPYRYANQTYTGSVTLNDTDYRTLIQLKISINNGHGTIPEIISACQTIFSTQAVTVTVTGTAAITVNIGRIIDPASALYTEALSFIPAPAGVAVTILFAGGSAT